MAAPVANDRKLGAEVRRMALKKVRVILSDDYEDKEFQKAVLLKLTPTLLPRLNEHTGEDGGAIVVATSPELAEKYGLSGITQSAGNDSE